MPRISQLSRNNKGLKIRNKIAQKYINAFSNFLIKKVPKIL